VVAELRALPHAPAWTLVCYWAPYALWAGLGRDQPHAVLELVGLSAGFALFLAWFVRMAVRRTGALSITELAVALANPAAYFAMIAVLLEPAHRAYLGLFTAALSAVQFAVARLVWRPRGDVARDPRPGALSLALALLLLTLAAPIQLEGFRLTIAWACEGTALMWAAGRYASNRLTAAAGAVLTLAMITLLALDIPAFAHEPLAVMLNPRVLTIAVVAASLFLAARHLRSPRLADAANVVGHLVVLLGLALEAAGWASRSYADDRVAMISVAISILLAVYAVFLVALGVLRRRVVDRIFGLVLIGAVVAKLYASDVWSLGRAFRVTAFLALGALLLLVSYLYSRYRPAIERLWKDRPSSP
jgi:hypothetical protein